MAAKKEAEEKTIEESLKELDTIVEKLESREISLEDSFTMYQHGMELLKQCSNKIDTVENRSSENTCPGSPDFQKRWLRR